MDDQMNIIYTTGSSVTRTPEYDHTPQSAAWIGLNSKSLTTKVLGECRSFSYKKYSADVHTVTLKGLVRGVTYYYKVGDTAVDNGLSSTFSFQHGHPTTYAVYGDYGLASMGHSFDSLSHAAQVGAEFGGILHLGDLAYNLHTDRGKVGDDFLRAMQPITARYPYLTIVGNHERAGNFTHYLGRFWSLESLGEASGSGTPLWYSWNAPHVHFIGFNTEVFLEFTDPAQVQRQLDWLRQDLSLANTPENRKKYPWLITFSHKCDWHEQTQFDDFRALFHEYGVDLHICGHSHNYQRLYPGLQHVVEQHQNKNYFVNPQHWVQLLVGSPGCQEAVSTAVAPYQDGIANWDVAYGYGLLTVHNATTLEWRWKKTSDPVASKGETLFDQAVLAMKAEKDKEMDLIKDIMIIHQEHHGMRSMEHFHQAMAQNKAIEQKYIMKERKRAQKAPLFNMIPVESEEEESSDIINYSNPLWAFQQLSRQQHLRPQS